MQKILLMLLVIASLASCNKEASEITPPSTTACDPVIPQIDRALHAKVLVVPANMSEYAYFQEVMERYAYNASPQSYGVRYSGKERPNLVVTLLKPGQKVSAKYGIVQLKGHTSDMEYCLSQARRCIVPGKTIVVSGGCESSQDVCMYANENIPAFTVDYIGTGPANDYLVLHMQSLLQNNSYVETLRKLKEDAPAVMASYIYPQ